jgi:hypothetical protein
MSKFEGKGILILNELFGVYNGDQNHIGYDKHGKVIVESSIRKSTMN